MFILIATRTSCLRELPGERGFEKVTLAPVRLIWTCSKCKNLPQMSRHFRVVLAVICRPSGLILWPNASRKA